MRNVAFVLMLICGLWSGSAVAQETTGSEAGVSRDAASAVAEAAVTAFIVPGYRALGDEARGMAVAMQALCARADDQTLGAARDQFAVLVAAWSRMEFVRFGPIVADNRLERVLFWPDRRGIALRQVQSGLTEKDVSLLDAGTLAEKSVALQGLTALEFVLFGAGSDDMAAATDGFRCRYGQAIALNIAGIADDVLAAWTAPDGIAGRFTDPEQGNADYRTTDEVLAELIGAFAHGAELTRDTRIVPILGDGVESAKPKQGLFWRSGQTVPSLAATLDGMDDLLQSSQLGTLLTPDYAFANSAVLFEFDNFARVAAQADGALADVLATEAGWKSVDYLRILTGSVQEQIGTYFSASLGLGLGFSSSDGD